MFQRFRHEIQVGHRLFESFPGSKCERIHGHSFQVDLQLNGYWRGGLMYPYGDEQPLEFGAVKKKFRAYLDENYDHCLLLNVRDPWAQPVYMVDALQSDQSLTVKGQKFLPGLVIVPGDPTTENMAGWLAAHFAQEFKTSVTVYIQETSSNGVGADGACVNGEGEAS